MPRASVRLPRRAPESPRIRCTAICPQQRSCKSFPAGARRCRQPAIAGTAGGHERVPQKRDEKEPCGISSTAASELRRRFSNASRIVDNAATRVLKALTRIERLADRVSHLCRHGLLNSHHRRRTRPCSLTSTRPLSTVRMAESHAVSRSLQVSAESKGGAPEQTCRSSSGGRSTTEKPLAAASGTCQ